MTTKLTDDKPSTLTLNGTTYDLLAVNPAGNGGTEMLVLRRPNGKRVAVAFRYANQAISAVTILQPGMSAGGFVSR